MQKVRTLFISDTHFGCKTTNCDKLYEYLKTLDAPPEYIYLVGDIIDGWKLKQRWYWNPTYNNIIKKILAFSKKGTKVFYIPGNHDEFLRGHLYDFGNIKIVDEAIHETADGKKLVVVHGDKFDTLLRCGKFVNWLGDIGYSVLMFLSIKYSGLRKFLGFKKHWSLSKKVKESVKKVSAFVSHFEDVVVKYTKDKDCDGIVCGHIHVPNIREIDNIKYYNCGDWVENSSLLIEDFSGKIFIMES